MEIICVFVFYFLHWISWIEAASTNKLIESVQELNSRIDAQSMAAFESSYSTLLKRIASECDSLDHEFLIEWYNLDVKILGALYNGDFAKHLEQDLTLKPSFINGSLRASLQGILNKLNNTTKMEQLYAIDWIISDLFENTNNPFKLNTFKMKLLKLERYVVHLKMSIEDELRTINLRKRIEQNFKKQNDADYLAILKEIKLMQGQKFRINETMNNSIMQEFKDFDDEYLKGKMWPTMLQFLQENIAQLRASNVIWEFVKCLLRTPYYIIEDGLDELNAIEYLKIIPTSLTSLVQDDKIHEDIMKAVNDFQLQYLDMFVDTLDSYEIERLKFYEPILRLFESSTIKLQLMFIDKYRQDMESSTDVTLKSIFSFMENNLDDEKSNVKIKRIVNDFQAQVDTILRNPFIFRQSILEVHYKFEIITTLIVNNNNKAWRLSVCKEIMQLNETIFRSNKFRKLFVLFITDSRIELNVRLIREATTKRNGIKNDDFAHGELKMAAPSAVANTGVQMVRTSARARLPITQRAASLSTISDNEETIDSPTVSVTTEESGKTKTAGSSSASLLTLAGWKSKLATKSTPSISIETDNSIKQKFLSILPLNMRKKLGGQ